MQNQPISGLDLDQVLAKRILFGSKPVCKNHWAWFLAFLGLKTCCLRVGIQPSTSFPLSDLVAFFHKCPDHIVQNQPGLVLVLADCVRF